MNAIYPVPYSDEALLSYLMRLARLNHFPTVHSLAMSFGLSGDARGIPTAPNKGHLLKHVVPVADRLSAMWMAGDTRSRCRAYGHDMPRHYVRTDWARYCPQCLADEPYFRQQWHLSFVQVCHRHQTHLVDRCPGCKRRVSWNSTEITTCRWCATSLTDAGPDNAVAAEVEVTRLLLALAGVPGVSHQGIRSKVIGALRLEEAVEFLLMLGRIVAYLEGERPGKGRPLTWHTALRLLATGYSQAKDWPLAFKAILRAALDGTASRNLQDIFGPAYKVLVRAGKKAWGSVIYGALREVLGETRSGRVEVNRSVTYCNVKEMGSILGLHVKAQVKRVADTGFFKEVPSADVDGRARQFSRVEVEQFVDGLRQAACSNCTRSGRPVHWEGLLKMAGQRKVALRSVLDLLAHGTIRPTAVNSSSGLKGLVFDAVHVAAALDSLVAAETDTVSMREVAKDLAVTPRTAYALVQAGFLATVKDVNRQREARVRRASLEKFRGRHVSVREIANHWGVPVTMLRRQPGIAGHLRPSVVLSKDGVQFFRRTDVDTM